jgi:hypothetical protein
VRYGIHHCVKRAPQPRRAAGPVVSSARPPCSSFPLDATTSAVSAYTCDLVARMP